MPDQSASACVRGAGERLLPLGSPRSLLCHRSLTRHAVQHSSLFSSLPWGLPKMWYTHTLNLCFSTKASGSFFFKISFQTLRNHCDWSQQLVIKCLTQSVLALGLTKRTTLQYLWKQETTSTTSQSRNKLVNGEKGQAQRHGIWEEIWSDHKT